ncbi:MAG: hypothetical protein AAFR27_05400 [Pseudomonadota bacterium]
MLYPPVDHDWEKHGAASGIGKVLNPEGGLYKRYSLLIALRYSLD